MSINPTVKIAPDDVVRYLLYQQFYYGGDRIYGRTKDQIEYIEISGKAIEKFYLLITDPIILIDEGNLEKYLEFFNNQIHIIPIKAIMDKYLDYKNNFNLEMDRKMTLSVVIGECLTQIHTNCFNKTINHFIDFLIEKRKLKNTQKQEIKKKIESLYCRSNSSIGMLYSLSFMNFIAEKSGYDSISKKCQELLIKNYNILLDFIE